MICRRPEVYSGRSGGARVPQTPRAEAWKAVSKFLFVVGGFGKCSRRHEEIPEAVPIKIAKRGDKNGSECGGWRGAGATRVLGPDGP